MFSLLIVSGCFPPKPFNDAPQILVAVSDFDAKVYSSYNLWAIVSDDGGIT